MLTTPLSHRPRVHPLVWLLPLGCLAALLLYFPTIDYGFYYDDYHQVRPHEWQEVADAFSGTWDATGIERTFYRPLTVTLFAARFAVLGFDARLYHLASLVALGIIAALAGWIVRGVTGQPGAALAACLIMVCHPAVPYSLAAWTANQMHLFETLLVAGAAAWWWFRARTNATGWLVLAFVFAPLAFLVKEDAVMLLPALLACHLLARQMIAEGTTVRLPVWVYAACGLSLGVLLGVRHAALDGTGWFASPWRPGLADRLLLGPAAVLLQLPPDRPGQEVVTAFMAVVLASGAVFVLTRRGATGQRFLFAAGLALVFIFDLPFAILTKPEQYHLLVFGSILASSAALSMLPAVGNSRQWRVAAGTLAAGGLVAMALVARGISTDFAPCGPMVRHADAIATGWSVVPLEVSEFLRHKCEAGTSRLVDLDYFAYGLHGPERDAEGNSFRWTTGRLTFYVNSRARRLSFVASASMPATVAEQARIVAQAGDKTLADVRLSSKPAGIPLRLPAAGLLGGMHRVELIVTPAWRPQDVFPGSADPRVLGVRLSDIRVGY